MHGKPTKQIVRICFSATDGAGASQHFWRSLRSVGGFGRQSVVGQSLQILIKIQTYTPIFLARVGTEGAGGMSKSVLARGLAILIRRHSEFLKVPRGLSGHRRVLLENCPGAAAVSGRPEKHRGESLPWSEWHQSELPRDPVPTS